MKRPSISVDFNEMLQPDLVLLSSEDVRFDSAGRPVVLHAGMLIKVFENDVGIDGKADQLIAYGTVEKMQAMLTGPAGRNGAAGSTPKVFDMGQSRKFRNLWTLVPTGSTHE